MATPETPYAAVLHAARNITKVEHSLDAEMLGAALLGSVYAIATENRAEAVREFVSGFLSATAREHTPAAATIRNIFARLVPDAAGAAAVGPGANAPLWSDQLGKVRLTGAYAYGDVYGDQTSYLATFAYDDSVSGGPEHAVVALVDHNIGITKDIFVGGPAERILAQARQLCATDELTWFREEDPGRLHGEVAHYLSITDQLSELPDEGALATDRALVGARLAVLPAPVPPIGGNNPEPSSTQEHSRLVREFLHSPEARRFGLEQMTEAELSSLHFCLSLVLDHSATLPDPDPTRFSPAVASLFLLDWVHRRAVLDMDDAALLPRVVRGWAAFSLRRRGLPKLAVVHADAAIADLIPEFVRLYATGERRSPATAAVAALIADGVDPNDADALDAWFETNRRRLDEDLA